MSGSHTCSLEVLYRKDVAPLFITMTCGLTSWSDSPKETSSSKSVHSNEVHGFESQFPLVLSAFGSDLNVKSHVFHRSAASSAFGLHGLHGNCKSWGIVIPLGEGFLIERSNV